MSGEEALDIPEETSPSKVKKGRRIKKVVKPYSPGITLHRVQAAARRKLILNPPSTGYEEEANSGSPDDSGPSNADLQNYRIPRKILSEFRESWKKELQSFHASPATPAREDRRWLKGVESKYKLIDHMYVEQARVPFAGLCDRSEWDAVPEVPVKGKLMENLNFWSRLGKSDWSVNVIQEGYRIPFKRQAATTGIFFGTIVLLWRSQFL